jgi:putative flippase GtrA
MLSLSKYILVQLFAYMLDIILFILATSFGLLGPIISNILGKILAGSVAFIGHRVITFNDNSGEYNHKQSYRYIALLAINLPISSILLTFALLLIDNVVFAKVTADLILVLINYWVSRKWVFIPKPSLEQE